MVAGGQMARTVAIMKCKPVTHPSAHVRLPDLATEVQRIESVAEALALLAGSSVSLMALEVIPCCQAAGRPS